MIWQTQLANYSLASVSILNAALITLIKTIEEITIDDWSDFVEFTNGVITNNNPGKALNLTTNEGHIIVLKHMTTKYANAESYMKDEELFRYDGIIKYDFKITLNPNGDRCENMKHIVYFDECVFYSSSKL